MEAHQSFDDYEKADRDSLRAEGRRDWLVWLLTSLGAGVVPFLIVAIVYRAGFETTHHKHAFPSFPTLFGGGELLLVILSVTGATLAEFWLNPHHLRSLRKSAAFAVSVLIGVAAGSLFTAIAYAHLVGKDQEFDHPFVAGTSVILLILVIMIQSITQLTRGQDV